LWPNAFVKARMLVETRKDAIVVPTVAIQRGPQGTYVYAVGQDKTAQMKPVTIALTAGEVAVIDKGLEGGEQVIIEGQNQVRPGGQVAPTSPNGGPNGGPPGSGAGSGSHDHGRGKRGQPGAEAGAIGSPDAARPSRGSAGGPVDPVPAADRTRQPREPGEVRPTAGQSRPRGPATGPTASTQAPAVP
jgi:multidrug efflux system membrane fusion protein